MTDDTKMREEFEKWMKEYWEASYSEDGLFGLWQAAYSAGLAAREPSLFNREMSKPEFKKAYESEKEEFVRIVELQRQLAESREALKRAHFAMKNYVRGEIGFQEGLEKVEAALKSS